MCMYYYLTGQFAITQNLHRLPLADQAFFLQHLGSDRTVYAKIGQLADIDNFETLLKKYW